MSVRHPSTAPPSHQPSRLRHGRTRKSLSLTCRLSRQSPRVVDSREAIVRTRLLSHDEVWAGIAGGAVRDGFTLQQWPFSTGSSPAKPIQSGQTGQNLVGQQLEGFVAERGAQQVIESNLVAQPEDLVDYRLGRAM
jgi:hypothetical protein